MRIIIYGIVCLRTSMSCDMCMDDFMDTRAAAVERHPLQPFMPRGARLLMLGTFPPQRTRWSMEFYYPNFQNDMWRILGLVFFGDRDRFVAGKRFDRDTVMQFCTERGIALSDTAAAVVRTRDNASDKYLDVVQPADMAGMLASIPECIAVAVTGKKAAEVFSSVMGCDVPAVGNSMPFESGGRIMRLYRMPSTSRAYPKPLEEKAAVYESMFRELGML